MSEFEDELSFLAIIMATIVVSIATIGALLYFF